MFSPISHDLWLTLSLLFDYMLFKENRNSCYIKNCFLSMWGSPTTIIFFKPLVLEIIINIEVAFSSFVIPVAHLHFIFQISNYLTVWEVKNKLVSSSLPSLNQSKVKKKALWNYHVSQYGHGNSFSGIFLVSKTRYDRTKCYLLTVNFIHTHWARRWGSNDLQYSNLAMLYNN